MRILQIALMVGLASSAFAQDKVWTEAPVPGVSVNDNVLPAARAGAPSSDDRTTPFSSVPSGSVAAGGATSPNDYNGVGTPNLSK